MRSRIGPVHDHRRRGAHRRRPDTVRVERVRAHGLEARDHDGQVLRAAAREDGVDRHLLDGRGSHVGRHGRHHLLRVATRAPQHAQHALRRGRDHREAVAEALVEHELVGVVRRADLDAPREQRAALGERGEALGDAGLDIARAAARLALRVLVPRDRRSRGAAQLAELRVERSASRRARTRRSAATPRRPRRQAAPSARYRGRSGTRRRAPSRRAWAASARSGRQAPRCPRPPAPPPRRRRPRRRRGARPRSTASRCRRSGSLP